MFKHRLAALALATSFATIPAACGDRAPHIIQVPAQKTEADRPGQMVVDGQATLEVSPDCADISITVSVESPKTGPAMKQLEARKLTALAALQKVGVEIGSIKLSSVHLDPQYYIDGQGNQQPHVRAYRAQMTVTATTKDFAKVGDIMEAAASAGATSMSTTFRRSDLPELKKKVRDMALAAAKAKAEQTATALGITLGRVVSVSETPSGAGWPYYQHTSNSMESMANASALALGGTAQQLTLTIMVGYELARQT